MEYVQERIPTLHDLTGPVPDAPLDRAAVVVPMTDREYGGLATEQVLTTLAGLSVERVVVPLRAPADRVDRFRTWLDGFELPLELLWCNGSTLDSMLDGRDLGGTVGKGRDVWLALGLAAESDFVVVHDADAKSYGPSHVPRLLFPLGQGQSFVKGYYARVENGQLYGRLFRLFYAPLVRALADGAGANDEDCKPHANADILSYLGAFRYALAGEFAMTAELAGRIRAPRRWGLEVGILGDAFEHAGFDGTAQVDLGRHEHDHRSVSGPSGLTEMAEQVGSTLFTVVEETGVRPEYETLPERYREAAHQLVESYALDAAFNGLAYDPTAERDQVETYADAVVPPADDDRLPSWNDAPITPEDVRRASSVDLADVR